MFLEGERQCCFISQHLSKEVAIRENVDHRGRTEQRIIHTKWRARMQMTLFL